MVVVNFFAKMDVLPLRTYLQQPAFWTVWRLHTKYSQ